MPAKVQRGGKNSAAFLTEHKGATASRRENWDGMYLVYQPIKSRGLHCFVSSYTGNEKDVTQKSR